MKVKDKSLLHAALRDCVKDEGDEEEIVEIIKGRHGLKGRAEIDEEVNTAVAAEKAKHEQVI